MPASRLAAVLAVSLLLACPGPPQPVPAPAARSVAPRPALDGGDPARISGRWHYRTRTNCDPFEGVGEVTFSWDAAAGLYAEQGFIYWATHRKVFRWWGRERYLAADRRLEGSLQNNLGDTVEARWLVREGELRLSWKQSNGCHGEGSATPREGLLAGLKLRRLLETLRQDGDEPSRLEAARELGRMGREATTAIPTLLDAFHAAGSSALGRAIWEALEQIRR